jgi:hypothetical protein
MKKNPKHTKRPRLKVAKPSKKTEEFPGYPLYPSNEDIMNRATRLDVDVNTAIEGNSSIQSTDPAQLSPSLGTSPSNSDLTKDDFQALASEEVESGGDDEILANRPWPVDFTGGDLDVPGSEDDDSQEQVGSEDEENNSYSIGSDRHRDLDERQS